MKKCSFCGMPKDNIIIGQNKEIGICLDCATKISEKQARKSNREKFSKRLKANEILKPYQIVDELNKYIISQDTAKKVIAVETYNHFKRINDESDVELRKNNMLIIGPTGSGKTAIVERLAKILNIPFVIFDATSLTSAGYIGQNVENCLARLYMQANGNQELAEKGIVYIDEIDKIAAKNTNGGKDVNGESVQQAFLKMMENAVISVEINKDEKIEMNTRNILFIFGGAFDGLSQIIEERMKIHSFGGLGTNESSQNTEVDKVNIVYNNVTPEDIINFGFIGEFIGRIPVIVPLKNLTKEDMHDILLNTENSIIKEYKHLFSLDGVNLEFEDDAIDYIVDEAISRGTGARGLRSIFSKQLNNLTYEITSKDNHQENYLVTKKFLDGEKEDEKTFSSVSKSQANG